MKKLLLPVLALIVLAGTIFSASNSLAQSDCLMPDVEVFLSDTMGNPLFFTSLSAVNQDLLSVQNPTIIKFNDNGIPPVAITYEESGVSSAVNTLCLGETNVNPEHDITNNGIKSRLGVAVYLC